MTREVLPIADAFAAGRELGHCFHDTALPREVKLGALFPLRRLLDTNCAGLYCVPI